MECPDKTTLVVDNRERQLLDGWLISPAPRIDPLDLGDVAIVHEGETRCLIERKTLADLASSITDGRYKEQKQRLFAWLHEQPTRRQVVYIIEGFKGYHPSAYASMRLHGGVTVQSLLSGILHTVVRDSIHVLTTSCLDDTRCLIEAIWLRASKNPDEVLTHPGQAPSNEAYTDAVKMKKQKNITPENILVFQLSQIPGISSKIATAIAKYHPTMAHLMQHLSQNLGTIAERCAYIQHMPVEGGKTVRTVGPKTAKTVVSYLGYTE